ncbi:MAG: NADH-quinone oxidoreductase subunit L [Deltaproteobacteria bacterium]|nr:NADH-quinone oxidoreductase subunit L [Deltaproteobacteria bacterium]
MPAIPVTALLLVAFPALGALIVLLLPRDASRSWVSVGVSAVQVGLAIQLFRAVHGAGHALAWSAPSWAYWGLEASFRIDHFAAFVLTAAAGFSILVSLYGVAFFAGRNDTRSFWAGLLASLALSSGAMMADNLIFLLFFWEGLLGTLFWMIWAGGPDAWKTAVKALVLVGLSDLCLMGGIALVAVSEGGSSLSLSTIGASGGLALDATGGLAFVLLMIGATSKAGSLPFHTWIPDAAVDAPLPFMAFLPAAIEKLLGIYLLARIALELFALRPDTWASHLLMVLGAATILIAVAMALVQRDYKRLLSYHAISQVGYMILGVGTAVPAGIVGGLFHMINHAMYKSCLFLTGGAVERQAGTTDLARLGGIGRAMPVTFVSFIVAACAISGVPPFNGFFSKELVYDGALERHWIYYAAALLGSVLTAASFLKLGHAAFLGKPAAGTRTPKEVPWSMWVPMLVLVAGCILFGVYNPLPLRGLIQPILADQLAGHDFAGLPHSWLLVALTCIALALALANHLWGARRSGSGLHAVDHIHHAPGLSQVYAMAERRVFDPYDQGLVVVRGFSLVSFWFDRGIDWIYDVVSVRVAHGIGRGLRALHDGSYSLYVAWSLAGVIVVALIVALS